MNIKLQHIVFFLIFCPLWLVGQGNNGSNFFHTTWAARHFQPSVKVVEKVLPVGSSSAIISIELDQVVAPVLPTHFGVNTTFRNGPDQHQRSSLYAGKATTLRFPAGSGSNLYFFDGKVPSTTAPFVNQSGNVESVTPISAFGRANLTPDLYAEFVDMINGEGIVVVNYFYARYGMTASGTRADRVKQAADYAAAFVRKMNVELKANIEYWEVGNECYGKWEAGYEMANSAGVLTGREYGEDFRVFAQAMKAVDPSIKVGVVVKDVDDAWNQTVLPEVKDHADFLVVHEYFTTVKDATLNNILGAVGQIELVKNTLEDCVVKYAGKPVGHFPVALTEFNSRGPYNCSMINGLFVAQVLGESIKNQYGLASLWVSEWNWSEADQESKGFLARADPEQSDYSARPTYLPYYFFGKCFGDRMVSATSTLGAVKVYASKFSSGHLGVVVVNTSPSTQTFQLKFGHSPYESKCQWYECYSPTVDVSAQGYKKFYINEQTGTTSGGGPADLDAVLPYQSAITGKSTFTLKPYSMVYLVVNPPVATGVNQQESTSGVVCYPNPVRDKLHLAVDAPIHSVELLGMDGQLVLSQRGSLQSLDLSNVPVGFYLLVVNSGNRTQRIKIMKS